MTAHNDPLGFPIHALTDGKAHSPDSVHRGVHERVRTHLLGQRTEDGIWPPHSSNTKAVDAYREGHRLLYDALDPVAAARHYENAANLDSGYLQAWVGLALAWTAMGTPDSIASATDLWRALIEIPVGADGISNRCMSILLQNLAYTLYQQFLYSNDTSVLSESADCYSKSGLMDAELRPELCYPWCNVLMLLGRIGEAETVWINGGLGTSGPVKDVYLAKYKGLSALDLRWSK